MAAVAQADARPAVLTIPRLPYQGALADPVRAAGRGGRRRPAARCGSTSRFPTSPAPRVCDKAIHDGQRALPPRRRHGRARARAPVRRASTSTRYYDVHRAFDEVTAAAIGRPVRITDARGSDVTFTLGQAGLREAAPRRPARASTSCRARARCSRSRRACAACCRSSPPSTSTTRGLAEPAALVIDGRIREVTGGGADRAVLQRALRRAAGGEYGHVIHFTHGIHPAARMTGESFIEDMRAVGNNAVGLGIPFWLPGGGENHPDAILTEQSIWIDGRKIVERRRDRRAPAAREARREARVVTANRFAQPTIGVRAALRAGAEGHPGRHLEGEHARCGRTRSMSPSGHGLPGDRR